MWITMAATCHQFRDETYLQKQLDTTVNITTLHFCIWQHHVSSTKHASFDPACTTPHRAVTVTPSGLLHTPTRPVCHCLSFDLDSDQESDATPMQINSSDVDQDAVPESSEGSSAPESSDEEEDFQTVPTDDEHWTTEMVPERTFWIHENGLPNNVCQYPCPYGNNNSVSYMDLSDIFNYKDYMLTTSDDEELPGLEEVLF